MTAVNAATYDPRMFPAQFRGDGTERCNAHMCPMAPGQRVMVSADGRYFCVEAAAHISTCRDSDCDCRYGF